MGLAFYPLDGGVPVKDATVFDAGVAMQLSVVELAVGELHYLVAHAVLHIEHGHATWLVLADGLHERLVQSARESGGRLDGGGKLSVVAS